MQPHIMENQLMPRLKFRQLKLLVTVGEKGNIVRASKALNMAQPAATKIIIDLEATLGLKLFDRSPRGVTPTMYGDILIRHAKLILSQLRQMSEELTSVHHGASGRVAVGTLLAAAPALLPKTISIMQEDRPNISIALHEGTNDVLMPALRVGDLDFVVGRLPKFRGREGLVQEALYNEPIVVVARRGHPLEGKKNLKMKKLAEYDWILPPAQTSLRRQIEASFQNEGVEPPLNSVESISILANLKLLIESDMLAVMPLQVALSNEGLCQLDAKIEAALGAVGVTMRASDELTPAAQHFLETLREAAKLVVADEYLIASTNSA